MKRLGRWLFNLAAVVSLILCLGTGAIWIVTLRTACVTVWHTNSSTISALSEGNILCFRLYEVAETGNEHWSFDTYPTPGYNRGLWIELSTLGGTGFPGIGIAYRQDRLGPANATWKSGNWRYHSVYAPHWLVFLASSIIPFCHLFRLLHMRKQSRVGLCGTCGYDLRATPDRCPECGEIPSVLETKATP